MLVSLLVGSAISHFYYERSLSDLKADAAEHRTNKGLLLRALAEIGSIEYRRDGQGEDCWYRHPVAWTSGRKCIRLGQSQRCSLG